jgi:predicted nucleic acid-binding protein
LKKLRRWLTNSEKSTSLKEVIDTRFLLEFFYSTEAATQQKISRKYAALLTKRDGILPTIVIAELAQITCVKRGKDVAQSRFQALIQSGLIIQDVTAEIAQQAGLLKCANQNLPMGDCIIASTALLYHAKVLSDDLHFDSIRELRRTWI